MTSAADDSRVLPHAQPDATHATVIDAERRRWLLAGLGLSTLATLLIEIIDTRLLSVLTWYHVSFFAVPLAMLGMAAGAVRVFLGGEQFRGALVADALPRHARWFAYTIAASHVVNLCVPIPLLRQFSVMEMAAVIVATIVLTTPFVLSGTLVTLALTRTGGQIGRLYAADLLGAALGCLLVIPLLNLTNITTAMLVAAAVAAAGAACFARARGTLRGVRGSMALAAAFALVAALNGLSDRGIGVIYPKNQQLWLAQDRIDHAAWNTHSYVLIQKPIDGPAAFWAGGRGADRFRATIAWAAIDGEAGTPITAWKGDQSALEWTQYDLTATPYRLRHGRVAVIGVGGGRDILSAIWGGNTSITGIEINSVLVDALQHRYRDFAKIAVDPRVTLVHDEARSYLTREPARFDVLQMSLVDTWAATGAGAFTLSENGLYTREGWRVFLTALTPTGVFSVSRWFSPAALSETTRLLALGAAALLDRGVANPRTHLLLLTRGGVATLMVSPSPFTDQDAATIRDLVARYDFHLLVAPWQSAPDPRLQSIASATTMGELLAATSDPVYDFTPPDDARPFFFNILKPSGLFASYQLPRGGVIWGNVRATATLMILLATATVLVLTIVVWPLISAGRPEIPGAAFAWALMYFGAIGAGYLYVQIALLQRFSVYLGHPTYTFAIILSTMILATGAGAFLSDRLSLSSRRIVLLGPVIAIVIVLEAIGVPLVIQRFLQLHLPGRSAVVVLSTVPLACLLGFCFPIGTRLLGRLSDQTTAWMWGVNGACGVLASILAVAISMWVGINANLYLAALLYATLFFSARGLAAVRHEEHGRA